MDESKGSFVISNSDKLLPSENPSKYSSQNINSSRDSLNPQDYNVTTDNELTSSDKEDSDVDTTMSSFHRFFHKSKRHSNEGASKGRWFRKFKKISKSESSLDESKAESSRLDLLEDEVDDSNKNINFPLELNYHANIDTFSTDDSSVQKKLYDDRVIENINELLKEHHHKLDICSPETKDSFNMDSDTHHITNKVEFENISPTTPQDFEDTNKNTTKHTLDPDILAIHKNMKQIYKIVYENATDGIFKDSVELEDLPLVNLSQDIVDYVVELRNYSNALTKENDRVKELLTKNLEETNDKRKEQKELKRQCSTLEKENNAINNKLEIVTQEYDKMSKKQGLLTKKVRTLNKLFEHFDIEINDDERQIDKVLDIFKKLFEEKSSVEEINDKLKAANSKLLKEFRKIKLEYQNVIDQQEDNDRKYSDSIEYKANKLENNVEYLEVQLKDLKHTVEFLQDGNKQLQNSYHNERLKVLDLRKERNSLKCQISLIDCYRSESLQFMSQLMNSFGNCVEDEVLYEYDFYLKALNNQSSMTMLTNGNNNDIMLMTQFKSIEKQVFTFYHEIAKPKFLDQVISKYINSMRSNNFLSNQVGELEQKCKDQSEYIQRITHYVRRVKKKKRQEEPRTLTNKILP